MNTKKYIFLYIAQVLLYSCQEERRHIRPDECPFSYISSSSDYYEKTKDMNNNAKIALGIIKNNLNNLGVQDSFLISTYEKKVTTDSVVYSQQFLEKHNGLVHILCQKYFLINQMDSLSRAAYFKELINFMDDVTYGIKKNKTSSFEPEQSSTSVKVNRAKNLIIVNNPTSPVIINNK